MEVLGVMGSETDGRGLDDMTKSPLPFLIASLDLDEYEALFTHVTRGALVDAVAENNKLRELVRELDVVWEIGTAAADAKRIDQLKEELGC